jgi:hypothetical protein
MNTIIVKVLSLLILIYNCVNEYVRSEWTEKFKCGGGVSCEGLDPPADGCYYNNKTKNGWCYHIVDKQGSIFFSHKKQTEDQQLNSLRFLQSTGSSSDNSTLTEESSNSSTSNQATNHQPIDSSPDNQTMTEQPIDSSSENSKVINQHTQPSCISEICSRCVRACYQANCHTPEECSICTCFPGLTEFNTIISQNMCCPLPTNDSVLN